MLSMQRVSTAMRALLSKGRVALGRLKAKREELVAVIAAVVVLVVVIAGGVFAYHKLGVSASAGAAKKEAHGYTLTPPDGWKRASPTPEGASVAFMGPTADADASGKLQPYVVVQSAALNDKAQQESFETIAKAYVSQLAQGYGDFQLISTAYKNIGGTPAMFVTFTFMSDKTAATVESLFTVKSGISYTVNGGALSSAWPQHASQIETSLLTFRP